MSIKNSIRIALKQNLLPGLVLQFFALIIVLVYFFVPAAQPVFDWFGDLKQAYGYVYAIIATAFFGGFIPFCYLVLSKRVVPARNFYALFVFYVVLWAYRGFEVDCFYRLQGWLFGYAGDFKTIATKALVDQFIYSAFWAAPSVSVLFCWMENNFNLRPTWVSLDKQFITEKLPTNILSNWLVWLPAVSIIYSMPSQLQIPLFNLVLCFWVLMLAVLNKKSA